MLRLNRSHRSRKRVPLNGGACNFFPFSNFYSETWPMNSHSQGAELCLDLRMSIYFLQGKVIGDPISLALFHTKQTVSTIFCDLSLLLEASLAHRAFVASARLIFI